MPDPDPTVAQSARQPTSGGKPLSGRESEVLGFLAEGLSGAAIAEQLVLSPKTVANHISSIFVKLAVANRSAAIVRARQGGLGGS